MQIKFYKVATVVYSIELRIVNNKKSITSKIITNNFVF